ncbi:hypothetical protein TNCV_1735911 [Trichonephila clavipes]|nr:hypothetical protein TNCV_1735911 [Trichonephila clavipes]
MKESEKYEGFRGVVVGDFLKERPNISSPSFGGGEGTSLGDVPRAAATIFADGTRQRRCQTTTAGSDVVQSGRLIFDDFFQHLWPYIGHNTANVIFQMVKRLWLIRIDP